MPRHVACALMRRGAMAGAAVMVVVVVGGSGGGDGGSGLVAAASKSASPRRCRSPPQLPPHRNNFGRNKTQKYKSGHEHDKSTARIKRHHLDGVAAWGFSSTCTRRQSHQETHKTFCSIGERHRFSVRHRTAESAQHTPVLCAARGPSCIVSVDGSERTAKKTA